MSRAHRIIRAICDLAGIKDLWCKVEGAMNPQHIVKAFMLGLLRQKTHQVRRLILTQAPS